MNFFFEFSIKALSYILSRHLRSVDPLVQSSYDAALSLPVALLGSLAAGATRPPPLDCVPLMLATAAFNFMGQVGGR